MKILIGFLALCLGPVGLATAQTLSSSITAATVYPDRAVVTRIASIDVPPGISELTFDDLPDALVDASVQVSGSGIAGSTILEVTTRRTFLETTSNERVRALEEEIEAIGQQIGVANDRSATLSEQREFVQRILGSVGSPSGEDADAPRVSVEDWQAVLDFAGTTFDGIAAEERQLQLQRTELERQRTAARNQLNQLRGAQGRSIKAVHVRLDAPTGGKLELALEYALPGASWTPAYDARLRSEAKAIDFSYHGVVQQNTGEDWTGIDLTLSTAQPSLGSFAPEPARWNVGYGQVYVSRGFNTTPGGSNAVLRPFEVVSERDESFTTNSVGTGSRLALDLADAAVNSSLTSATFRVTTPATVPSDNSPQKFPITTARLEAELSYNATPRVVEAAFLTAKTRNATDYPLLAGPLNSFLDNTFVATGSLETIMPGEEFDLAFGVDDGIGIARRVVNRFTEETGLGGRGRRITYEFLVTLTNNRSTSEQISFREPTPVSSDERIEVVHLAPSARELNANNSSVSLDDDGILEWDLTLAPGEEREIPIRFAVEFAADVPVSGLE